MVSSLPRVRCRISEKSREDQLRETITSSPAPKLALVFTYGANPYVRAADADNQVARNDTSATTTCSLIVETTGCGERQSNVVEYRFVCQRNVAGTTAESVSPRLF